MTDFPIMTGFNCELDIRSRKLRQAIVQTLAKAGRGHLASAFSLVEILRVLYDDILTYDPSQPKWPSRDRFILSKGHGCLAQYVLLAEKGFFAPTQLDHFCQKDGLLGGHPDHRIPGIEASTGSLGHGLSLGVGMALNEKIDHSGYRTFVVLGDGECNEGSIWEAAMCAAGHRLAKLTVIVDYNQYQSYGPVHAVQPLEPLAAKWRSFGFRVEQVNGHDVTALNQAFSTSPPDAANPPTAFICHTVKGKGIAFVENNLSWHHKSKIAATDIKMLLTALETDRCDKPV